MSKKKKCMSEKSNLRAEPFLVVGHQVCTHLRRDFVPLLFADPRQVIKALRLTFGNSNLQVPPQIFYGIKIWRLAIGHSRTLMCFFLSHSFVALAVCFGSFSCWNTHPRPIFNALAGFDALALMVHGLVHRPFDAVQLSCPLSRKTPPKHNVPTFMFDGGDGVLGVIGSIPPPPNTASWVDAKELDFGLIWPQHFHPVLLWIIAKLQTVL